MVKYTVTDEVSLLSLLFLLATPHGHLQMQHLHLFIIKVDCSLK